MERVKGIEPSYEAWEAAVLPLNYTRNDDAFRRDRNQSLNCLAERAGFEPAEGY